MGGRKYTQLEDLIIMFLNVIKVLVNMHDFAGLDSTLSYLYPVFEFVVSRVTRTVGGVHFSSVYPHFLTLRGHIQCFYITKQLKWFTLWKHYPVSLSP